MERARQRTSNLELVERALGAPTRGVDLVAFFRDDAAWADVRETIGESYTEDCMVSWIAYGQRERELPGPEGLRQGWLDWLEPWAEYRSETEEVRPVGDDKVLVFARQIGIPHEGAPVEMQGAALVTIRDGRISAIDFYAMREEAMAAAGVT